MNAHIVRRVSSAVAIGAASICLSAIDALAGSSPSPENARVYFVNLTDGQNVTSPVKIIFGLEGMGVAPAGVDNEVFENVGHHHLFIDADLTDEIVENGIPLDAKHLHFGKGQTETRLDLPKGEHRLRLVFADPRHVPHNPVVASQVITIRVQ